jgi:KilA-N domain
MAKKTITVEGSDVTILLDNEQHDFFSITDIAKKFNQENPSVLIINWMRTKDTLEFLGVWEKLNNPHFNLIEFDKVKQEAGYNRFIISVGKWISTTNAIGMTTKSGRYGSGTYAHKDIALAFCYWLSPPFQLYVIREFQRLKEAEVKQNQQQIDWNLKRAFSKINYAIHTDAVKSYLIPQKIQDTKLAGLYYASEADLLNLALFGMTSKEWHEQNPSLKGNMRDYAPAEQLLVLANLENLNAEFIKMNMMKEDRLKKLNEIAIYQIELLVDLPSLKALKSGKINKIEE